MITVCSRTGSSRFANATPVSGKTQGLLPTLTLAGIQAEARKKHTANSDQVTTFIKRHSVAKNKYENKVLVGV
jgi:hypothetical protein